MVGRFFYTVSIIIYINTIAQFSRTKKEIFKVKKSISTGLIVLMLLSALLLASCGKAEEKVDLSDSKYVGTWKATTLALKDESEELGASYVLTLNGDGTGQFVDAEDISYITWELTEDGFRTKGDTKLRFTDDGDNIKTNIIGVDMIFERQ